MCRVLSFFIKQPFLGLGVTLTLIKNVSVKYDMLGSDFKGRQEHTTTSSLSTSTQTMATKTHFFANDCVKLGDLPEMNFTHTFVFLACMSMPSIVAKFEGTFPWKFYEIHFIF